MADNKPTAAKDFRRFFANWFQVRFSDNDITIVMGLEDQKGIGPDSGPIAEAQVLMTPRTTKVLSIALAQIVARFERDVAPIPLPAGKEQEMLDAVKVTRKTDVPKAD